MKKQLWTAGMASALLLAFVMIAPQISRAATEGHFDKTLTVNGPVDLEVQTGSGNITVHPGAAGRVEIHATIRAGNSWFSGASDVSSRIQYIEQHPPIQQDGNTITIGHEDDRDLMRNISISYDIVTPAQTNLHSATGSGNQTLQGIAGPVDSTTGSGDLDISAIGAEVTARSGSGSVKLQNVKGDVRASTGSGDIHADGVAGAFSASTGSGDVEMTQTAQGTVEVSTGSGEVELSGVHGALRVGTGSGSIRAEGTAAGDWSLHTGSGDLTVRLPKQSSFDLYAHTSSGSIDSSFPITMQGRISPRDWHGKVGSGGPSVELRTSSGTIRLESL